MINADFSPTPEPTTPPSTQSLPIPGPLGLGDLLDRAFRLYRAGFWRLVLTAAVVLVPVGLVTGLVSGQFMLNYMDALEVLIETPNVNPADPFSSVGLFGNGALFVLFSLVTAVLNGVVTLALTAQAVRLLHRQDLSVRRGLGMGVRRFLSYLWMQIVRWFLILISSIVVSIPLFGIIFVVVLLFGTIGPLGWIDGDAEVLVMVGGIILVLVAYIAAILLLLIPLIYLSARWIGAVPAMMAEGLGGVGALRRSWRLSKKQVWRCVGYLILLYLLTTIVFTLPVTVVQQILLIALPTSVVGLTFLIATGLSSVAGMIFTPFYSCAVVLLYYDLRVRAENYDLEMRVAQAEAALAASLPETSVSQTSVSQSTQFPDQP